MSIDLDAKDCVLCNLKYAHLDKFIGSHYKKLVPRISQDCLYKTLYQYLESNRLELKAQGVEVPILTEEDITIHFEYHYITFERVLVKQIREAQRLEERVLNQIGKNLNEKSVNLYIKLSNHRVNLIQKLQGI